jgi:hypothetical protein
VRRGFRPVGPRGLVSLGCSAIVGPDGRVLAETRPLGAGLIVADIPTAPCTAAASPDTA